MAVKNRCGGWTRVCAGARVCLLAAPLSCSPPATGDGVDLPAAFEADRIFVDVAVRGGETLRFFTDTGGGLFLFGHAADRVLPRQEADLDLRELATDASFPEPLGAPDGKVPIYRPDALGVPDYDGLLGQAWFADRIWTLDYAARKLRLHETRPTLPPAARTAELGFLTDDAGVRQLSFPRIRVVVAGETLDLLLDTGAMVDLTPQARERIGDSAPATRATSFATSELLRRWRLSHPEWRVIPEADARAAGMAMIEVPEVTIAGMTVGPVWFTERPDANFHDYMSQWMDRRIDGALGGNALRFFRVTLDYPGAAAHFVRADPG